MIGLTIETSVLYKATAEVIQVYLDGILCPNTKAYFSVGETYTSSVDRIINMILMAKASKTKINFQYNTTENTTFCYVTGIRLE